MKIEVIRRIDQPEEVDVNFPLFTHTSYHFDEGNGYDTFQRIEADGKAYSVSKNYDLRGNIEFEFGIEKLSLVHDLAEYLTPNDYNNRVVDEVDFIKAVEEAKAALEKFPALTPAKPLDRMEGRMSDPMRFTRADSDEWHTVSAPQSQPAIVPLYPGERPTEPGWYVRLDDFDRPACVEVALTSAGQLVCDIAHWDGDARSVLANELTFIARIYPDRIEGREG